MTPKPPSTRYEILSLRCWHCGDWNSGIRYDPSKDDNGFRCEHCRRRNRVEKRCVAVRPEDDGD